MANGNVYAPLYSSIEARGRLSPLGAPGALKPEVKKKGLGDKMAQALGGMIDQAMEGDDKKRIAQLTLRNEELRQEDIAWEGTPEWNQENYEWEAFGIEHSGHKREAEFYKNLEEIKQIEINQHMGIFDKPIEGSNKNDWTSFIPFLT
jgi:hypothetical protein